MKKLLPLLFCALALTAQTNGLKLLETQTASGAATLSFSSWYSATHDDYQIEFASIVPTTNNVTLCLNFSSDGGATYDGNANYDNSGAYVWAGNTGAWGAFGQGCVTVLGGNMGNAAGYTNNGTWRLKNPADANNKMLFGSFLQFNAAVGYPLLVNQYAVYHTTTAIDAFQVSISGGGYFSGTVRVYGLAK